MCINNPRFLYGRSVQTQIINKRSDTYIYIIIIVDYRWGDFKINPSNTDVESDSCIQLLSNESIARTTINAIHWSISKLLIRNMVIRRSFFPSEYCSDK